MAGASAFRASRRGVAPNRPPSPSAACRWWRAPPGRQTGRRCRMKPAPDHACKYEEQRQVGALAGSGAGAGSCPSFRPRSSRSAAPRPTRSGRSRSSQITAGTSTSTGPSCAMQSSRITPVMQTGKRNPRHRQAEARQKWSAPDAVTTTPSATARMAWPASTMTPSPRSPASRRPKRIRPALRCFALGVHDHRDDHRQEEVEAERA